MKDNTIRPEWDTPRFVGLVYPRDLEPTPNVLINPKDLVDLYDKLICFIVENTSVDVKLYVKKFEGETFRDMEWGKYVGRRVFIDYNYPTSIWIRDFAPTPAKPFSLRFQYAPNYLRYYPTMENIFAKKMQLIEQGRLKGSSIALDGGNVSSNGEAVIVSENIYIDNAHLERNVILGELMELFKAKELIVIPVDKYDYIGHSDGAARFVGPRSTIIPLYGMIPYNGTFKSSDTLKPSLFSNENAYVGRLKRQLESRGLKTIFLPSYLTEDQQEGIFSAEGCYLNYIQLSKDTFIVPDFPNAPADIRQGVIDVFENELGVKPLMFSHPNLTELSILGGVLNCISCKIF